MTRIYQDDAKARAFASARLGCLFADPMIGVVVERDGVQVGAVIFNNYTPGQNINLTGAGHGWTPKVIRELARYCFKRVRRVTATTRTDNAAAIKALRAMGFQQEGVYRDYFPDCDAVVFGLTRREQKLIKVE